MTIDGLPSEARHERRMVGKVGLEPTRFCNQRILSPPRIPAPPLAHEQEINKKTLI